MAAFFLILSTFFIAGGGTADTWKDPDTLTVYSPDSTHFAQIIPQHIPERYFDWKEGKRTWFRPSYSEKDTVITPAHAILYEVTDSEPQVVWNRKIVNKIAPVTALLADGGEYLVTFDNWYYMGYGVDVLVVYNDKGDFIKRHNLEEISPFPLNSYFYSIPSIHWRCGEKFIKSDQVELCFVDENENIEKLIYSLSELKITD